MPLRSFGSSSSRTRVRGGGKRTDDISSSVRGELRFVDVNADGYPATVSQRVTSLRERSGSSTAAGPSRVHPVQIGRYVHSVSSV